MFDRGVFCIARREYKSLLHKKKKEFNDALLHDLVSSVNDQYLFWEKVHKISITKGIVRNTEY